ncbi:hypothetical protein DVH24_023891, partial [Malus domestica]
ELYCCLGSAFAVCLLCGSDVSTDGKWCCLVFWVMGKPNTRWNLLTRRLLEVCSSYFLTSGIFYYRPENQEPKPPDVFLLKFWCSYERDALLHDVTEVLFELELTINRVKVLIAPDGRVMDLFFVTDTRFEMTCCEIELAGSEVTACSQGSL